MKNRFPIALLSILFILTIILNACSPQAEPTAAPPADTSTPPAMNATPTAPATPTASATNTAAPTALSAVVRELTGRVEVKRSAGDAFAPAQVNSLLDENGQAMTGSDGKTRLDLSTGTIVRVAPNSLFTLTSNQPAEGGLKTRLQLAIGKLFIILSGGSMEVETPTGTAAVRGSYMSVSYDSTSGGVKVTCLEGRCSLSGANGSVEITAGQTAVITGAGQPPIIGEMSDEDIQEWLSQCPEAQVIVAELLEQPAPPQPQFPASGPVVIRKPPKEEPAEPEEPEEPQGPSLTPTVAISGVTPTNSVFGQPLSVAVYVAPSQNGPLPTGTVTVIANGGSICSSPLDGEGFAFCSGGVFTLGAISLVAKYSGDTSYLPAQSTAWAGNTVTTAGTTTTLDPPLPSLSGSSVTFTATVDVLSPGAGTPYGSVTFSDGSVTTYCIDTAAPWECAYTFSPAGPYTIQANYSGDSNFTASFASMTHHVLSGADTEFGGQNGPTGSIAICSPPYQAQAWDIHGINGVQVEYRIGDSIFVGTDLKENLTWNAATQSWEGSFMITALNTDTVYWRFIAADGGGNNTFLGNDVTYVNGYTGSPVDAYSFTGPGCP